MFTLPKQVSHFDTLKYKKNKQEKQKKGQHTACFLWNDIRHYTKREVISVHYHGLCMRISRDHSMVYGPHGGCSPFSSLLLSQQFTNLAAVFAHCCISPSRYGSFLSLVMSTNSLWVCVNCGKYVSLMSWYRGQVVRKCSSVSTTFSVQWVHSLSSLGSGVCLWRPFSVARLRHGRMLSRQF